MLKLQSLTCRIKVAGFNGVIIRFNAGTSLSNKLNETAESSRSVTQNPTPTANNKATEAATADHPYRIRNLRVRSLSKRASSRFHEARTSASHTVSLFLTFCNSSCPA